MPLIAMTLSDAEGHSAARNLPNSYTSGNISCINGDVFTCE